MTRFIFEILDAQGEDRMGMILEIENMQATLRRLWFYC